MIKVTDLPAVRARLERTAEPKEVEIAAAAQATPESFGILQQSKYPAKCLILQNGRYHVADHDK